MGQKITKEMFPGFCVSQGLPRPVAEMSFVVFAAGRRFVFDWAWPNLEEGNGYGGIALEMEGGVFGKGKPCPVCKRKPPGAHSSVGGILRDIEKYNLAQELGWKVFRCLPDDVASGKIIELLKRVLH